ncbi:hypothetical protein [Bradyrhizobium sp.]|uniref:hypothetical protein n=1 Tax=Bradyrhizobium sp. TaxID=376 RepID=UPI001ED12AD4|nr:hypothetical protein [Bradyrhizobium sp.]MBV9984924.1 hypothetical protein [Bradyrhizobium sp.]
MRVNTRPQEHPVTPTLRRQRRRWDEGEALPMALGCLACPDVGTCGGIRKRQDAFSCLDDCCGNPSTCDGMCPNNPVGFRDRWREVNGLELDNIPRTAPCPAKPLPAYVPYIYHGNRRAVPLDVEAVALPLRRFHTPDGRLRFASRAEVEATFGIGPQTRIILIGSGRDKPIEAWWKLSERRLPILAGLRALGVALITGPNYSMFTDEVRYNDMHAMKRIGKTWQEIVAAGVPGAYHLNARTPKDYARLTAFLAERPEVTDVAFEFKTGASWRKRLPFHVGELTQLAARAGRPLSLTMIGGIAVLPQLAAAFERVTYIDTSAFMNSVYRQRLYLGNDGKMKKYPELTLNGQPIDGLLVENLATMKARIESFLP